MGKNPFEDSFKRKPATGSMEPASKKSPSNPFHENSNPFYQDVVPSPARELSSVHYNIDATLSSGRGDQVVRQFKLTSLDLRNIKLRSLCVGDNLALLASESSRSSSTSQGTEFHLSRRDVSSLAQVDGSIVVRDPIESMSMDASSTHMLMFVQATKPGQTTAVFHVNPQDAVLKARGPLSVLAGMSTVCWSNDSDSSAFVGYRSGQISIARFTHNGLADVSPYDKPSGSPVTCLVASSDWLVSVDATGALRVFNLKTRKVVGTKVDLFKSIRQEDQQTTISALLDEDTEEFWILVRGGLFRVSVNPPEVDVQLVFEENDCFALSQTRLFVTVLSRQAAKSAGTVHAKLTATSKITLGVNVEKNKVTVNGVPPLQFARDGRQHKLYLMSDRGMCLVEITDEEKGAWKLYLKRALDTGRERDFSKAVDCCASKVDRDVVRTAQADWNFSQGRYIAAAELYVYTPSSIKSFEEIALSLTRVSETSVKNSDTSLLRKRGLRTFLTGRLARLDESKKTLRTMLSVWICETFFEEMDHQLEPGSEQDTVAEFCTFLGTHADALEPAKDVIFHLILSHGRVDMLLVYAHLTKDFDRVITHHLNQDKPLEAIRALRDFSETEPATAAELFYRHSAALITQAPQALVEAWLNQTQHIEPVKLIPALSKYDESAQVLVWVTKYLEHAIDMLGVRDEAIHNLMLAAYAKDEDRLYHFVKRETSQPGGFCFDAGFALRICVDSSPRSRILLLDALNMPEVACRTALELGMQEAAQRIAQEESARDEDLGKRLWKMCCEVALRDGANPSASALAVLKASHGFMSIEDLLPLLPESANVDEYRDEVCSALERYNTEIERLKAEMDEHTECAQALRRDATEERSRFDIVKSSSKCDACGERTFRPSSSSIAFEKGVDELYIFPCTHVFHSGCLYRQVVSYLHGARRDAVSRLMESDSEEDKALLEEIMAKECPFCGEAMIQSVAEPLIFARDEDEARSWEGV